MDLGDRASNSICILFSGARFALSGEEPQNPSLSSSPAAVRKLASFPNAAVFPASPALPCAATISHWTAGFKLRAISFPWAPVLDDKAKMGSLGHCILNWSWPCCSCGSPEDKPVVLGGGGEVAS